MLISESLILSINCLKDKIDPIIKINFKILGKVSKKLLEKTKFTKNDENKKRSKYNICLFKIL